MIESTIKFSISSLLLFMLYNDLVELVRSVFCDTMIAPFVFCDAMIAPSTSVNNKNTNNSNILNCTLAQTPRQHYLLNFT